MGAKGSLGLTITEYVPVVGAFVATCTAEAPAELVASSTPVGDTRRIQGLKPADTGATSPIDRASDAHGETVDHRGRRITRKNVPAVVAPFVRSPPSSPAEGAK